MVCGQACVANRQKGTKVANLHAFSGSVTEKDVERIQINPRCLISGHSLKQRHETTSPVSALQVRWRLRAFYNTGVRYVLFRGDSGLHVALGRSCMETACEEIRYALRILRKYPAFRLTLIINLSL